MKFDPSAIPEFAGIRHVHVIGVCGTLMGAFAAFMKRSGLKVTGSDQNVYPPMSDVLARAGVSLMSGYRAENLAADGRPDLVVIGNVIGPRNPEARAAIDGGYRYTSLPEAMERFMLPRTRNILASGTHGKTTTSSMLTHVLRECGRDPSWFIGGVSQDLPHSFHVSSLDPGAPFVLEGDEYDTAFWDKVPKFNHYLPNDVILTSVEYDHADIYPDLEAVVRAFEGLADRIREGGRLIACTEYAVMSRLISRVGARVPVITYAREGRSAAGAPAPRFTAARITQRVDSLSFDVLEGGRKVDAIELDLPGAHNALNALAVWIEARQLELPADRVRAALKSFRGVKRRQEERGEAGGVLVIDDFAHHPTAVKETLAALKDRYPQRRLVAVFEPRSATSRRKVFQQAYSEAFDSSAKTFICRPYDQSNISSDDQFSSEQLVADMRARGVDVTLMDSPEAGVGEVAAFVKPGDLVAVLSNGGFGGFIDRLLASLRARR